MEEIIKEGSLRLFTNEITCDVIFSCQGSKLSAHRLILCIASTTLRELLIENTALPVVLIFPETSPRIMTLVLEYIYTGCVSLSGEEMNEFLLLSQFLRLNLDMKNNVDNICVEHFMGNENKSGDDLSRWRQEVKFASNKSCQGKTFNKAFPSPWTQRQQPLLEDPRNKNCSVFNTNDSLFSNGASIDNFKFCTNIDDSFDTGNDGNNNCVEVELKEDIPVLSETVSADDKCKKKVYKCKDCEKSFSQLRNYKYHRSVHDGTDNFSTFCPECGKTFRDKGYLSSHMKIHRDRKEYACQYCPKRFNQRVAYNMHVRIHTGIKPHECPTCGKSFNRKILLKQHQRVHTGEKPYECAECGKAFADRSNMSLHARLHTGIKPYACTLCPKSFTKRHHLNAHMNFHNGLKPFKCQNCGIGFSQSSNMRTHYKRCLQKPNKAKSLDTT